MMHVNGLSKSEFARCLPSLGLLDWNRKGLGEIQQGLMERVRRESQSVSEVISDVHYDCLM